MANVMLKYLKFARILNRHLSFSAVKYYPGLYLSRSSTSSKFGKSYATAAYKLAVNDDINMKNFDPLSGIDGKDSQSIDAALAKVDSLIRRNGRTQMKNIHKILSLINSKEATSSLHALYLLRSCKFCFDEPPTKRIKMVNEIWNKYQEFGIEFDVRHYNAMLDVHAQNRLDFNPVEILASMEDLKIEPNKDTYMLIMKKYCQDGNINGASEILEYMKEKQMTVDEKVFNYLIDAHINNNDLAGANEMVEVMRSSNLEPTADTHAALACGYAANGDKENMMLHLKKCKGVDNIRNYFKVIEALESSGNPQYIDDVLSLIENKEWYQQDFINAAVELIHKECVETAYKYAVASCTSNFNEGVNIFVKQLIKVGRELSEILDYCEKIRTAGLNRNIHIVAARAYVEYDNPGPIVQLFKRTQHLGFHIRSSFFMSLFNVLKDQNKGCWSILKIMAELGVPADFRTYNEAVYPNLGVPEPEEVLNGIKQSGQSIDLALSALFVYYCNIGKIDYALRLAEKFSITISPQLDIENLVRLYKELNRENSPKYFKLLRYIFMEENSFASKNDVQGKLLAELIMHKRRLLEILLDKFEDLSFSEYTLYVCEQELDTRNPSNLSILRKLKEYNSERESRTSKQENLSVEEEDKYISHLQAENMPCRSFLINRILHHIRTKNVVRLQQLLAIFDEMKLEYAPLMLCNLFGLWCTASDIQKAKEVLDKLQREFPDFQVDLPRALDYVGLLIKYEKFDESYELLKDFISKPHHYPNRDTLVKSIKRLNVTLSSTQNNEFVKKMQNLMLPLSNDLGSKKSLLDPSVNIHLMRSDLKSALEEFRNIVVAHRVPACLNQFLKKCINTNEKDILQQVIDLTISCAGKSYALLELAVAFIEGFQTQNAAKVIESLGSEADPQILDNICGKLSQQNKLNELEDLIQITQSLNHVDRDSLYRHAFRTCANRKDFQRALQLYEKLKAEVGEPHPETVKMLQNLLKSDNQPLPLSVISGSPSEISPLSVEATKTFLEHLEAGSLEFALKELSILKKGYIRTLPLKTMTDLVDLCLQKNCTQDLSLNVHAMTYILDNIKDVLKPLLQKYSEAGDIGKFTDIISFIPDFSLISVGFNAYFNRAFISSGQLETLLSHLEERVNQKNKLFSIHGFEELLKLPEYEERVFNLAVKYLDSNYLIPMAVVWAHYFSRENYEKANEIYKKYPVSYDKVDFIVIRSIKQNENVELANKYVEFAKDSNVRSRIKERAYGTTVDLLIVKGLYDEATDLVVESIKNNLELHKYYLSTLVTLKSILEKENRPVPFSIPIDTTSASDSDSN